MKQKFFKRKNQLLASLFLLLGANTVNAYATIKPDSIDDKIKGNKDYANIVFAESILKQNQDNPLAVFYIAENYLFNGDNDLAMDYYIRAAQKGFEPAIKNVYYMASHDLGVVKNIDSLVSLLVKQGTSKNDLFAQMYLGDLYRNGVKGVTYQTDYDKSFYWYSEAELQGDNKASYYIGTMTLKGLGTAQNIPASLRFLEKLAEKSHYGASYLVGKVYKLGYYISQNHQLSIKYFEQGAKYGHVLSMYEYADSLEKGYGISKSPEQALSWFESAAEYGHGESAYRAGLLHVYRFLKNPELYNLDKGIRYLEKASDANVMDADLLLGDIYFEGKFGKEKNYLKAEAYYKKSLIDDDASKIGYKKLSMLYREGGYGISKDLDKYKDVMKKFYEYTESRIVKKDRELFNIDIFNYDDIF